MPNNLYILFGKRTFDLVFSLVGFICLLPVFLIITLSIKIFDKGPVFYIQKRVGVNFQLFNFYKFRTMIDSAENKGPLVTGSNDPRITIIGGFLRKYKLDELPQLVNVIKGDISIVGPRPEVEKYVSLFKNEYQDILQIKPGITDFAALHYRNEEAILAKYEDSYKEYIEQILPEKIKLYYKYINSMSLITDIEIIVTTIGSIF